MMNLPEIAKTPIYREVAASWHEFIPVNSRLPGETKILIAENGQFRVLDILDRFT